MKKTFKLTHEKIKYPRLIESAKAEVRKCVKRNRRKELPKGVDFWDFECKFGITESEAKEVHLAEIDKHINEAEKSELKSFYIEILPAHGHRQSKAKTA